MDTTTTTCPQCHIAVRPEYYFCYNCGKNLKEAPPSISIEKQLMLYLGSIVLPPMGIIWAVKYLKQPAQKYKIVGITAIVLTVLSGVISTKLAIDYITKINEQVTNQLNGMQGF